MGLSNIYLRMLLEADGDDADAKKDDPPAEEANDAPKDANTTTEDTPDDKSEDNPDDSTEDDNNGENEENKEDNPDENQEDENSEGEGEGDDFGGSDFGMDGDNADDGPPPDGLTDPDDDGSSDASQDDTETNVHTNILQLSKLDRTLAKRKCYANFMDLRTSIGTVKRIIDSNEAKIDPEVRGPVADALDDLFSKITDYITIKFPVTNYEENLQNYLIFARELNDLTNSLDPNSDIAKKNAKERKKAAKKAKTQDDI